MILSRILVAALLAALAFATAASPLFEDRATNLWIGEPGSQQLLPLTANRWLDAYLENGQPVQPLVAPDQALVNGLPASSVPMQPGQPAVSIIGLGEPVATVGGGPVTAAPLRVWPESGLYRETLRVEVGLAPTLFNAPTVALRIARNGGAVREIVYCAQSRPAGCVVPQGLREGYRGHAETLARNGTTTFQIEARSHTGAVLATASRSYEIAEADPRRDTDGDGIPDIIEELIGLDAFSDDALADRDGDGWSDFDEWLRCPAYDAEMRCPAVDDPNQQPLDTDGDGWSDFDETLRGTRVSGPFTRSTLTLPLREGETAQSETYRDRQLRFFERPAARRLYEREFRIDSAALTPRAGTSGAFTHAAAQTVAGKAVERLQDRVDEALLQEAGLSASALAGSRLRANAAARLAAGQFPIPRLPAAEGVVLEAWQPVAGLLPEPGVHTQVHKAILPPLPDLRLQDFLAEPGTWSTPAEFREALVRWLEQNLVVSAEVPLTAATTRSVLALEQIFSEEARVNAAPSPLVFNDSIAPVARPWLPALLDVLDAQAAPADGLTALLLRLQQALLPFGALADVAEFIDAQTAPGVVPVAAFSDLWLAERWRDSGAGVPDDCVLPDVLFDAVAGNPALAVASGCAQFLRQSERGLSRAADRARRFALRSLLLLEPGALLDDLSLLDPNADSDGDGLSNAAELEDRPLPLLSRPDLVDSDGDGVPDAADPCPLDPLDGCFGALIRPRLDLPAEVVVRRGGPGGVAAIPVGLSRATSRLVSVQFEAIRAADDSAVAGVDFSPVAGSLLLRPGSTLELLAVPILAGGSGEKTFSVQIKDVDGAAAPDPLPRVRVRILEGDAELPPPEARITAPETVAAGALACLDGRGSLDPIGLGLGYQWAQASGPAVMLDDAGAALTCFTAPAVSEPTALGFTLTVTDADGRQDTASRTITVNPAQANRPPELVGEGLSLSVRRGETLVIPKADILAAAVDPDGDPLSIGEVLEAPPGGVLRETDTAFEFRPYRGLIPVSPEGQRVIRQFVAGSDGTVVLTLVEGPNFGRELWRYDGQTDAPPRRLGEVDDLIATPGTDVYYTTVVDPDVPCCEAPSVELQRRTLANDALVETLGRYPTLTGLREQVRLDPRNGDLYFCEAERDFEDGEWARIPASGSAPIPQGPSCFAGSSGGGSSGPEVVAFAQGYCFVQREFPEALYCAQPGPSGQRLRRMQTFEGQVSDLAVLQGTFAGSELKIIERFGSGTRLWTLLTALPPDGPFATLPGEPIAGGAQVVGRSVLIPTDAEPSFGNRQMQVYRWDEAFNDPVAISVPVARGDFRSGRGGFTVDADGRLYWFRVDAGPQGGVFELFGVRLARLDPAEFVPAQGGNPAQLASFTELKTFFSGAQAQAGSTDIAFDGEHITLYLAGIGGVAQCELRRVAVTAPFIDEELARGLECFKPAPTVLRPALLDPLLLVPEAGRFDGLPLLPEFFETESGGEQVLPVTGFSVPVADPDGAAVEVPIDITVLPEAAP